MSGDHPSGGSDGPRAYVGPIGNPEHPTWRAHVEDRTGRMTAVQDADTPEPLVQWARQRSTWVLVHHPDGNMYWAGTDDRPDDVFEDWPPQDSKT